MQPVMQQDDFSPWLLRRALTGPWHARYLYVPKYMCYRWYWTLNAPDGVLQAWVVPPGV